MLLTIVFLAALILLPIAWVIRTRDEMLDIGWINKGDAPLPYLLIGVCILISVALISITS
jgi:drug/metabolite transporter (DMT)-like permease